MVFQKALLPCRQDRRDSDYPTNQTQSYVRTEAAQGDVPPTNVPSLRAKLNNWNVKLCIMNFAWGCDDANCYGVLAEDLVFVLTTFATNHTSKQRNNRKSN
jgi:hypothetical protein